ncbi:MAG: hypothetical protein ACLQB1_36270, partial [Streptosporangiaceae bacterium]
MEDTLVAHAQAQDAQRLRQAPSRSGAGRTRPRYLITSARVQVLFSCWASATAFSAARDSSSSVSTGPSALRG